MRTGSRLGSLRWDCDGQGCGERRGGHGACRDTPTVPEAERVVHAGAFPPRGDWAQPCGAAVMLYELILVVGAPTGVGLIILWDVRMARPKQREVSHGLWAVIEVRCDPPLLTVGAAGCHAGVGAIFGWRPALPGGQGWSRHPSRSHICPSPGIRVYAPIAGRFPAGGTHPPPAPARGRIPKETRNLP